ncbi:MAG TPA: RNA-binding S4 domain-containing protein [Thermoanaerobaculia bacterium]|nr:RNA-binding S4 domain-containing protein [Thermoanaerobaculia bacterium]
MSSPESGDRPRIDTWLKHACLFKHRSEATESCRGGLVKVNGERIKPSSVIRVGDLIEISEPRYRKLVVLGIPPRQASKEEARALYRDETPELPKEEALELPVRERGAGRPTKRERRITDKLRWG